MSNRPLHLYDVLEDEYERLHGEPPPPPEEGVKPDTPESRLRKVIKDIHKSQHSAICLSGGGIRSATFGLGVLQGLAHHKLLHKFSYLSTVSGGGYVGGWLSAWIHRHPQGVTGVAAELPSENPELLLSPEPEPITHLRSYSNYLTPQLGLLSADTWTLVAIVGRNLILNWLVLIPLIVAALALPRLFVSVAQLTPTGFARWAALTVAFICGAWMIAYVGIHRPSIAKKHCDKGHFFEFCLLPLLVSATLLALYWAWINQATDLDRLERHLTISSHSVVALILFGVLMHLAGWVVYSFWLGRFKKLVTWKELLALIVNGAVGGVLLWAIATRVFPHPTSIVALQQQALPAAAAAGSDLQVQILPTSFCVTCASGAAAAAGSSIHIPTLLTYASVAVPIYLILVLLALTLFAGISSRWTEDEDREWWARFGGWTLMVVIVWALASSLVLLGPGIFEWFWAKYIMSAGGVIGVLTALLGSSAKSPTKDKQAQKGGLSALIMSYALPLGAVFFAAVLVISLSLGTNYLLALISTFLNWLIPTVNSQFHLSLSTAWVNNQTFDLEGTKELLKYTPLTGVAARLIFASSRELLILIGLTGGLGMGMAYLINTNKFSYHAMYRNRLIRAYLGASRKNRDRSPNPFTGFDPEDNLPMHELRPELFHSESFKEFDKLVARLADAQDQLGDGENSDPASTYIVSKLLSSETQTLLNAYKVGGGADQTRRLLQHALIIDLNKALLQHSLLFPPEVFQSRDPRRGAAEWILGEPGVDDLVGYKRRLLETAFEDEILRYPKVPGPPLHVVNMTLNLVHGDNLAWQERKAESFTVSPLHCGSFQVPDVEDPTHPAYGSYRKASDYGGQAVGGITLGTAVAISGAAVSPNMGYYSSPIVTFLMTLFNVRLGWWLGNPGPKGEDYYKLAYPKSAVYPIVAEALGLTDDKSSYVYLSDGGHFENLGLYEMVLRRCALIVVSDASADVEFQFDGLGNAVQKIRADFGIPIDFQPMKIFPRKDQKKQGAYCAIGTIRYSCVDTVDKVDADGEKVRHEDGKVVQVPAPDGTIIYIKPVFYGDEPRDIYHYAMTHDTFPHESTADQWFSEAQFESYRKLGSYIVDTIYEGVVPPDSATELSDPDLLTFLGLARNQGERVFRQ
jgi:hypothetical protein